MRPVIYCTSGHPRAKELAQAMALGFQRHGLGMRVRNIWNGQIEGDIALAYGWAHEKIFSAYKAAGANYAYWDLGYWNRHPEAPKRAGAREGHHRLAINSWDTADCMRRQCPPDRLNMTPVEVRPPAYAGKGLDAWMALKDGRNTILVAGMSEKAAGSHGYRYREWEDETIAQLRELTAGAGLSILYRDKPARKELSEPIMSVLQRCCLVVSHHSNVAVDALCAGVPSWCKKGVGRLWSAVELQDAVACCAPSVGDAERQGLLSDIAYAQWTPAEMRSGQAWDHIRGLL